MNLSDVLLHFGSIPETAKALGITDKAVYAWQYEGRVPIARQYQLQVLTGGVLQVEMPVDAA